MTIKAKLTANVIIVVLVIGCVAATGFLGMRFIREKLSYLTEKSTPYQMRTVDLQRAIQAATADLIKVGSSRTRKELDTYRAQADISMKEVKDAQEVVDRLSGATGTISEELNRIYQELTAAVTAALQAEETADLSGRRMLDQLRLASNKLKSLDTQIRSLQSSSSTRYATSVEEKDSLQSKVRSLEMLKTNLKDLKLTLYETSKRSNAASLANKATQNGFIRNSPKLKTEMGQLLARINELSKMGRNDAGYDAKLNEVNNKLDALIENINDEGDTADEKYGDINSKQGGFYSQSNVSVASLSSNAELLAYGITVEWLVTRLFTVQTVQEIDRIAAEINTTYARIGATEKQLDASLKKINAAREQKAMHESVASLNGIRNGLFAKDGVVAALKQKIELHEKASQVSGKLRDIVLAQAEQGKKSVSTAQGEQEKSIATVNSMVRLSISLIGIIGLAAIAIGIGFGIWIYRSIARPLSQLISASDMVAKGDLTASLVSDSKDEVGNVQKSMAEMVTNLRSMVERVLGVTHNLASSSEELSATVVSLEKSAVQQTMQIEQAATAMNEMNQTTGDVAQNSMDTADAAGKMKEIAEHGRAAMQETVKELDRFAGTVRDAATMVESLGQQSHEIDEVVTLIKDVADQTNLLALNAAIEAARAGDMGRGFAVVADNVRGLAERTTTATDDISHIVQAMQQSVAKSIDFMKHERDTVDKVVAQVNQTLESIDNIVAYVGEVTSMVQRIAVAADEQSSTSEEINRNMAMVDEATKEQSKLFVDIRESSVGLSQLALDLKELVGWFKV